MPQQDIFVDGVGGIAVTGTLVRLELLSLTEPGTKESQPKFQSSQRLVMPLDGFVRLFGTMENVMKKMVEAGVVTVNKPQTPSITISEPEPVSPNFIN